MRTGAMWVICGLAAATAFAAPPKGAPAAKPAAAGQAARYLEAAIRMYRAFEFERALQQLERARSSPSEGLDTDVAIGLYEGIIQLELGREDQASAAFKTALTLDPAAKLPISVSPKVQGVFDKAKASIAAEPTPVAATPTPVPAPTPAEPAVVVRKPPPPPSKPFPVVPLIPGVAGVALGIGGAVLFLQAQDRAAALNGRFGTPNGTIARQLRDEGKLFQTLGVVGFALAGVGLAATIVLFVLPSGGGRAELTVSPSGLALVGAW